MPISDYASAIFFDRRNRVTLKRFATRALAICKVWPSIDWHQCSLRVAVFHKPALLHCASKITGTPAFACGQLRCGTIQKEKARREPGFLTNIFCAQFYFASFAI